MSASLRDVARRAGVSVPTASRVLSGSDYPVGDELRQKVQRAAAEVDYVPNVHARALLGGGLRTVGVLAGHIGDPYFSQIIDGIQAVASEHNFLVTICNTGRDIDRELGYFTLLQSHRTEVVIVAGSELNDPRYTAGLSRRIASYQASGGRVVAIGHPHVEADRVMVDNRHGAQALAEHLVSLGHRQVGVLAGLRTMVSTQDRISGLTEVVKRAGGKVVIRYVEATRDGGFAGAAEVLGGRAPVTAVVGTADQMAVGALAYLRQAGTRVPEQMSVAGFNDIALSRDVSPALTTVALPLEDLGRAAMTLALSLAPDPETRVRHFQTELIVRESTGPVPSARIRGREASLIGA